MPLIMTYANYINSFKDTSKALAYFGNIKGFNEFKELTECYHIGINRYEPIVYFASAGALVPITGFGRSLAKGAIEAVKDKGLLGVLTGGLTATAGGIAAAVIFAYIFSLIFSSKTKKY